MCEHKDAFFFDVDMSNPIDSTFEQIEVSTSDVQLHEGRTSDPMTTALLLLKSRAVRLEQFRNGHADIDDVAWHILLDLLASTNNKKPVTAHDLAITHHLAINTMSRYVEYLITIGMIDRNDHRANPERANLSLTAAGDALARETLGKIGNELAGL